MALQMKKAAPIILILLVSISHLGCNEDIDLSLVSDFGIFTVQTDGTTAIMDGEIKSRTLDDFKDMLEGHPNIGLIQIADAPGSNDDEINFEMGVLLNQRGIDTHLLDNAEAASGGVDFFLAGVKRTRGTNTRLGVHSWSDGRGNEATDFPEDSEEHSINIEYYEDLGFTPEWAREFYFFTIYAASARNIHWMTEDEITQFGIFN